MKTIAVYVFLVWLAIGVYLLITAAEKRSLLPAVIGACAVAFGVQLYKLLTSLK